MDLKILISEEDITKRVREMAREIRDDYDGREIVVVGILKGCFMFLADLTRAIDLPMNIGFMGLRSYGSATETSGVVEIAADLSHPIQDKDVLIVEDIVDTGLTMKYLIDNLSTRGPTSLKVCTLLHKPDRKRVEVPLDYVGFTVPDKFVVGYGLDHDQKLRNLPYIACLEE
ncbi:MAG: hypoxanthine phosphoribosyltransferase [Deltaproteobacteria bacterium]|nr:hypoxanthine phosphoribosyltransferase [Deltaproteobacteria bacterium]